MALVLLAMGAAWASSRIVSSATSSATLLADAWTEGTSLLV